MRILFLTPYPFDRAPSQRFRFEQYLSDLRHRGWTYRFSPFLDEAAWSVLYKGGYFFLKAFGLMRGYLRRFWDLLLMPGYDVIFIHREASPFGPPWIEYLIAKIFRKPIVFDFDDAIWIPNASATNRQLTHRFKNFGNAAKIISWSEVISCGNRYLADYASQFNANVVVNPTTIDTDRMHNLVSEHSGETFIIGWTGSHSTVHVLEMLLPVFRSLETKFHFKLHVICDVPPAFELKSLVFIPWSKESEVRELLKFNVGIMPLKDDAWAKGKCGFKALQYLSVGVPAVVSDVGVNATIVDHGVNGYICKDLSEWETYLTRLMTDRQELQRLSSRARVKVLEHYSVASNRANFRALFEKAINP